MYWFVGTGTAQQMSAVKLRVLSRSLKTSMVIKGLALILFHKIKHFTNLWDFWESIYEYYESIYESTL